MAVKARAGHEIQPPVGKRIERTHADCKNHSFGCLAVRGLFKVKAHALRHALANNLMAARPLRAAA
jgi:hypothetical protein